MALISCEECGRELSERANICPGCGAPNPIVESENRLKNYGYVLLPLYVAWIISSIYLIYKNWIIAGQCFQDTVVTSSDLIINFIGKLLGVLLLPMVQLFNATDFADRNNCFDLFDPSLVTASRIAIGSFLLLLIITAAMKKMGLADEE